MRIGNVDLFPVSDGSAWIDGGALYGLVPRVLWEQVTPPDTRNRVRMQLTCLVIHSAGKTILVDTGYGSKLGEKRREILGLERNPGLPAVLAQLHLTPEDVDIIINTHLHADHCGGNTIPSASGPVPAYRRAEYWVQRREWADALSPNERTRATYLPENLRPVAPQLRLLDGDTRVTAEVRCVATRGHTRAHQSVIIESAGETAIFLGDLAPLAVHFERLPWISANDTEPLRTLETKRCLRRLALERQALLIFEHDPVQPLGRLAKVGAELKVVPAGA